MFAMVRKLSTADKSIKDGKWTRELFMGNQLSGNTLCTLGLGNIAFHVAKVANSLGMAIVAYDPFGSQDKADSINATLYKSEEDLPKLFAQANVLTIHVPLTSKTRGMIGKDQIALMPEGSYIVNCARGGIVDEEALASALQNGHLAGAAADVFDRKKEFVDAKAVPLDCCMVTAPNITLTPHIGAMTMEAQAAVAIDAALQVKEYFL